MSIVNYPISIIFVICIIYIVNLYNIKWRCHDHVLLAVGVYMVEAKGVDRAILRMLCFIKHRSNEVGYFTWQLEKPLSMS
jgi:hypothetical protein